MSQKSILKPIMFVSCQCLFPLKTRYWLLNTSYQISGWTHISFGLNTFHSVTGWVFRHFASWIKNKFVLEQFGEKQLAYKMIIVAPNSHRVFNFICAPIYAQIDISNVFL